MTSGSGMVILLVRRVRAARNTPAVLWVRTYTTAARIGSSQSVLRPLWSCPTVVLRKATLDQFRHVLLQFPEMRVVDAHSLQSHERLEQILSSGAPMSTALGKAFG